MTLRLNAERVRDSRENQDRADLDSSRKGKGRVIWITGLSGAGKSTIAREVVRQLRRDSHPVILLDGDEVRAAIADPHVGYDRASRLANAMRICRLSKLLADQGIGVVTATLSLFREVHEWNRRNLPDYFEVYLQVSRETLKKRNPNGLISRMERGELKHVVGGDQDYDEPQRPDLILENEVDRESPEGLGSLILNAFWRKKNEDPMGLHKIG